MNSLKLEFEEERIRLIETAEETSKDANRLREQYNSSSRQALDIEELSMRTQGIMTDLERANNKIAHLTSQNETLISQLKNNEYLLQ
jgi:archaellum component FlaC